MKLAEVFQQLAYGELSQLFIGENNAGEIQENKFPIVLASVNLGLTALHKRFNLREGRIYFPLTTEGNVYQLTVTDLHKIERIETKEGTDLPLNDGNHPLSCFTPKLNTVRVPWDIINKASNLPEKYITDELLVIYRANHPKITEVNGLIDPEVLEVDLPYSHLEALLYFVASRIHNPIGMVNEFNAGNNWAAKYEMECQRLEQLNLEVDEANENTRLINNGWV